MDNIAEKEFESNDSDNSNSTMKKMKIEISRLQDENDELLNEQYTRETEIRMEVRGCTFLCFYIFSCHLYTCKFMHFANKNALKACFVEANCVFKK